MSLSMADALARLRRQQATQSTTTSLQPKRNPIAPSGVSFDRGSIAPVQQTMTSTSTPALLPNGFGNFPALVSDPGAPSSPPRSKTAQNPYSSPQHPKIPALDPNTPPKLATPDRHSATILSPAPYHNPARFDDGTVKKKDIKKMASKPVNSLVIGPSPDRAVKLIKQGLVHPNPKGLFEVPTSDGQDINVFALHSKNNADGTNRLIPFSGRDVYPLSGAHVTQLHTEHKTLRKFPSLKDHILKRVEKRKSLSEEDISSEGGTSTLTTVFPSSFSTSSSTPHPNPTLVDILSSPALLSASSTSAPAQALEDPLTSCSVLPQDESQKDALKSFNEDRSKSLKHAHEETPETSADTPAVDQNG